MSGGESGERRECLRAQLLEQPRVADDHDRVVVVGDEHRIAGSRPARARRRPASATRTEDGSCAGGTVVPITAPAPPSVFMITAWRPGASGSGRMPPDMPP